MSLTLYVKVGYCSWYFKAGGLYRGWRACVDCVYSDFCWSNTQGSNTYKEEFTKIGDCPFSHRVMMICKLKDLPVEVKCVSFRTGDDKEKKFKTLGSMTKKVPVLVHQDGDINEIVEDSSDIADYLETKFPEPSLKSDNDDVQTVGLPLFSKFSAWMREPEGSDKHKHALENELRKLNEFLSKGSGRFLDGDTLKLPDCNMLPKLHHIIVASKSKKGYTVPADQFESVLRYFEEAIKESAFSKTAPEDKEIEDGWRAKKN